MICPGSDDSQLAVSGFAANPGSIWLISTTRNGVTNNQSSAISYSYSNGIAEWSWSQPSA
jgi:hypothetical protein